LVTKSDEMAPFWCFGSLIGWLHLTIGTETVCFVTCATKVNSCRIYPGGTLAMGFSVFLIGKITVESALMLVFSLFSRILSA